MKEEKLLEVLGQIDPKFVAAAQRYRGKAASRENQEYNTEPERGGSLLRWMVPASCALAVLALVLLVPLLYRGGAMAETASTGATDTYFFLQVEPTATVEEPPFTELTPYEVVFKTEKDYWALRETADLPNEALAQLLQNADYSGLDSRERLHDFLEDTQYLPIPNIPGDTIKEIRIKEHERAATFEFSDFTMTVEKIANKQYAQAQTSGLSLIWDYEGYPLYMGTESIVGGVVYLELRMNAEGYLVGITAETADSKDFVDSLEGLAFQFPESGSATTPVGVYGGETEWFQWRFVEQTGTLTFSPLRKNVHVFGYIIHSEAPWQQYAQKITSVVVEEGIAGLGDRSITQLPNLQSVSLPNSLEVIGDGVFAGCAMQELRIPSAVTDIGTGVAEGCMLLRLVEIAAWQPHVGQKFLQDCPALEKISIKSPSGYWQQVIVPANPHLVDVSVDFAMEADYDLTALYDENGVLWSYLQDDGSLAIVGTGVAGTAPAGILKVWDKVQTVAISEGITAMEGGLAQMTSLRSVSLPSTLETMVSFFGCSDLEKVTVPDRIRELPSGVFQDCSKLKYVALPAGLEKIQSMAFGRCSALEYISIPNSVSWIDGGAFWACLSLTEVRLPDSLRRLKIGTFQDCVQLHTVTLPGELADIENYCFDGCTALRELKYLGTQAQWDKLYGHCADAIPEGVNVDAVGRPLKTSDEESDGVGLLWLIIPAAAVAAAVIFVAVIKRRGKNSRFRQ